MRTGKSTIRFHDQGQITLSKLAVETMQLNLGDKIEFLQDEEDPKAWFIAVSEIGFDLRKYSNHKGLVTNTSAISKQFLKSVKKEFEKSAGCLLATEPTEVDGEKLWAIITKSIN